jgi:hypothetical protein
MAVETAKGRNKMSKKIKHAMHAVGDFTSELKRLGFDEFDEEISGADCIDMVNEHYNDLAVAAVTLTYVPALVEALRAAVIPLERLGDFIGNEDKGGASGLGPFDRCAILLQVRDALTKVGAL